MFLSAFVHSLSRYDGLEAWQTSKLQNRRPLFDVELYLTVHKSFISTSLNIIHRGCTFHLSYPYRPNSTTSEMRKISREKVERMRTMILECFSEKYFSSPGSRICFYSVAKWK